MALTRHSDFVRKMPDFHSGFATQTPFLRRIHIDSVLLITLIAIALFGLFVLYSASGQKTAVVMRQGVYFAGGFVMMFIIAQFDINVLRRWSPLAYITGLALLLAVLFYGDGAKGARRWLDIAGLPRFQPAELMKVAVPMTVAWYFAGRTLPPTLRHVVVGFAILALPVFLVARQPDLGTSLLIGASGLFVLFLAGLSWRYIIFALIVLGASAPLVWQTVLHDYQKQRILTLLNPEEDKLGAGWNIIQSKTAIGSGGMNGKGWLNGTQSQLDFLPESHTDFIIAVLAEELGMVGVLVLLVLYMVLLVRGLMIALQAQDTFSRLLVGSITLTFFVYVFVNMGMVSGLLPVVGVPLPFVSQGGTSLVTLLAAFGILMAVSTEDNRVTR